MKFDDIMSQSQFDVGLAKDVEHHIETGDAPPAKEHPRRINPIEAEELMKQVKVLMKLGFVRESNSPWAAPVVLVRKKDGTIRFCIDHRSLNRVTKKDSMPLPRVDDTHDRLAGCEYFTSLDFVSGYYHVRLSDSSCEKTAFHTPFGLYEWTRMTMGLCNAPGTFQRLMNRVLGPLMYQFCLAYLDDIIIYSKDFDSHLQHIEQVLEKVRDAGLKIKPQKSKAGETAVEFLGSRITKDGISVQPDKIRSMEEFPVPRNEKMLRAFLGLTGYYRRFVHSYALITTPLLQLTKKDALYHWTRQHQEAFDLLKLKLTTAPVPQISGLQTAVPCLHRCKLLRTGCGTKAVRR